MRCWILLLLLPIQVAASELYKSVDKDGNVIYTDVPPDADAEPIKLPQVNVTPAIRAPAFELKAPEQPGIQYQKLEITSPENDSTVFINATNLNISVLLIPGVNTDQGHNLQILLNEKILSEGARTRLMLDQVDRGTHTITARVIDSKGSVLISAQPVSVHIKQPTILNRPQSGG